MKSHYRIYLLLLVMTILFSPASMGQEPITGTKSRKAKKAFEKAMESYREFRYGEALIHLNDAVTADSGFFEAWVLKGDIHDEMDSDTAAIEAYTHAMNADPERFPGIYYLTANLGYENGRYVQAMKHYVRYLEFDNIYGDYRAVARKRIESCRFAIEAMKNPVPFDPVNMGSGINSKWNDYFPSLTADNSVILFTRLFKDDRSATGRQEDFYVSYRSDTGWSQAKSIGPPINTVHNEGAPSLSADGNYLFFTACESLDGYGEGRNGYGRCDLFLSEKTGNRWSAPENVGAPVNSRHWESQPSFSADGKTLYFISNRNRDYDIWYSMRREDGTWSQPLMLDSTINTPGYEGSVFIHPDGQTLYFSSDGHTGMGGLDIFLSRKDTTGNWGKPENLGYPINTHKDENSIVIDATGDLALFASDREGGYGGLDIYKFELHEKAKPLPVTYMKGIVFDDQTGEKLEASFELIDLGTEETTVTARSDRITGEFLVCIPTGRNYALNVSKEGYLFYSEHFSLEGIFSIQDPLLKNVPLKPIREGESIVLRNIFFETDRYNLKPESKVELNRVVRLMNNNPSIHVEIAGHTDDTGTHEYNEELSENRAKAVYEYLADAGIDPARITYKGYGETRPIASNETEEGRASNRRTEFRIIRK